MTIERNGFDGDITFMCDGHGCVDTYDAATTDFHEALREMKDNGWVNRKDDQTQQWGHYCPSCKTTGHIRPFNKEPVIHVEQGHATPAPEPKPDPQPRPVVHHSITLGNQQAQAADLILDWYRNSDDPIFTLAGYAGAGKTTLARYLSEELENRVQFCALTGKAVEVLRSKGCGNVETIHGLLYKPVQHDKTRLNQAQEELKEAQAMGAAMQISMLTSEIETLRKEHRKPKFDLDTESGGGNLLFVDEYSMLPNEIVADLRRKYKKILFMGDPFQLPPVKGNCNLEPNFFLTEIHRQALESAIVRMSKDIRENNSFGYGDYGDFKYIHASQAAPELYLGMDQIIVGRNATRSAINTWYRQQRGIDRMLPVLGDKMICLKNDKKLGIFNGMICNATDDAYKAADYHNNYMLKIDVPLIDGSEVIHVWEGDVMGRGEDYDWNDWSMKSLKRFDYAYAITCHKSQGSEFDRCLVYHEPVGEDDLMKRRWLYTAITRGKKEVWMVQP